MYIKYIESAKKFCDAENNTKEEVKIMDGFDIFLSICRWMGKNPGKTLVIIIALAILGASFKG